MFQGNGIGCDREGHYESKSIALIATYVWEKLS